ncbi:MAG: hypothetical protein IT229_06465, partial [Flavobacteriales bacterium]|nr:hypothetical protein [Flavobacteriales bacterium]
MKALPLAFAWAAMAATASAQPGTLDPTFGSGGVATFTTSYDLVNPLTLHALSDGRFLSTGIIQNSQPSEYRVLLFRTDTNGQLDNGFGQQGLVAYAPQGYNAQGFSSLLRADGSVI